VSAESQLAVGTARSRLDPDDAPEAAAEAASRKIGPEGFEDIAARHPVSGGRLRLVVDYQLERTDSGARAEAPSAHEHSRSCADGERAREREVEGGV
jgi:hypothetical protein